MVKRGQALPDHSGQLCACVTRLRSLRCSFVAPLCRLTANFTNCAASALNDQETVLGRLARAVCTACRRYPDSGGSSFPLTKLFWLQTLLFLEICSCHPRKATKTRQAHVKHTSCTRQDMRQGVGCAALYRETSSTMYSQC